MTRELTPYDEGRVLEPRPWSPVDPETGAVDDARYGRVDFDDDESSTVLTVSVESSIDAEEPHGNERTVVIDLLQEARDATGTAAQDADDEQSYYRARIDEHGQVVHPMISDQVLVVMDGMTAFMVSPEDTAGLAELCSLARRGKDDFDHQAQYSDYSEEEVAERDEAWDQAMRQIERIEHFIEAFVPEDAEEGSQ